MAISAVIPTFNRRQYIGRAVRSALPELSASDEIIVIDDGSTDGTADVLRAEFGSRLRIIEQANAGVSAARRRGVLEASGEWIAFLDSDDEWVPGRMAAFGDAISRTPSKIDWIFGDTTVVESGSSASLFRLKGLSGIAAPVIVTDPLATQFPFQFSLLQSSLVRRATLLDAGAFVEDLRSSEDFLISFRAALRSSFAVIPDNVTRLYRTSDLTDSSLARAEYNRSDYYRARVLAFDEAVRFGSSRSWRRLHEEAVRGLCVALAREGSFDPSLALQQFRHGGSAKAVIFSAISLFGPGALRAWGRAQRRSRPV